MLLNTNFEIRIWKFQIGTLRLIVAMQAHINRATQAPFLSTLEWDNCDQKCLLLSLISLSHWTTSPFTMSAPAVTTRQMVGCPIFGVPSQLPISQLPTKADVIKLYMYIRYQLKISVLEPSQVDIVKAVSEEVMDLWNIASVPTVSSTTVKQQVVALHADYRKVIKVNNNREAKGQTSKMLSEVAKYRSIMSQELFDICSCKCKNFETCKCPNPVPAQERDFIQDQRGPRLQHIGRIDKKTTAKMKRRQERLRKEEERRQRYLNQQAASSSADALVDQEMAVLDDDPEEQVIEQEKDDDDFRYTSWDEEPKNKPVNLTLTAIEMDRVKLSDRAGARIINALLTDLGIIGANNTTAVVDRHRLERWRKKTRDIIAAKYHESHERPRCLYFDGKKDATIIQIRRDDRLFPETITEDHYCICDPDGNFVGHFTVPKEDDIEARVSCGIVV